MATMVYFNPMIFGLCSWRWGGYGYFLLTGQQRQTAVGRLAHRLKVQTVVLTGDSAAHGHAHFTPWALSPTGLRT
jgi:hypothetical protein